jgi:phosphoribosylamine--glycine ligase
MNILFISKDLSGGDLAYRLKNEGNEVRLFIEDEDCKECFDGMVEKTDNWENELEWVGKSGLIVFDGVGYGKIQDKLRKDGYSVVGGCEMGDKLEHDRQYGQKIFSACGLEIVPTKSFKNIDVAIDFVKRNQGPWVIKQNGHSDKIFNYVGTLDDGRDVIDVLKSYREYEKNELLGAIDLQKRVDGIEIGTARYFNGNDWIGPIEINIEHKNLFAGGFGPKTDEMGTLMWYDDNENNKLFQETLGKLKAYLREINFKGDIDINCIVNKNKIFPLEVTARFGWPAIHSQEELHISLWSDFLKAVADGNNYELKYERRFAITVLIAIPPFPYKCDKRRYSLKNNRIYFKDGIGREEMRHIHFEEVSMDKDGNYFIAGNSGFILNISSLGGTVKEAREKICKIANKIVIPKKFYRNDIGLEFEQDDWKKLKEWGWV